MLIATKIGPALSRVLGCWQIGSFVNWYHVRTRRQHPLAHERIAERYFLCPENAKRPGLLYKLVERIARNAPTDRCVVPLESTR